MSDGTRPHRDGRERPDTSTETWPQVKTPGDLTNEHYGLEVSLERESMFTGGMIRRTVVCDELRR